MASKSELKALYARDEWKQLTQEQQDSIRRGALSRHIASLEGSVKRFLNPLPPEKEEEVAERHDEVKGGGKKVRNHGGKAVVVAEGKSKSKTPSTGKLPQGHLRFGSLMESIADDLGIPVDELRMKKGDSPEVKKTKFRAFNNYIEANRGNSQFMYLLEQLGFNAQKVTNAATMGTMDPDLQAAYEKNDGGGGKPSSSSKSSSNRGKALVPYTPPTSSIFSKAIKGTGVVGGALLGADFLRGTLGGDAEPGVRKGLVTREELREAERLRRASQPWAGTGRINRYGGE